MGRVLEGSSCKQVNESKKMENISERGRDHEYRMDPTEYLGVENEAASMGEEVVGIYHSHPNAPAMPSLADATQAWPSLSYVIIEVRDSKPMNTRSWIFQEDKKRFLLENIEIRGAK